MTNPSRSRRWRRAVPAGLAACAALGGPALARSAPATIASADAARAPDADALAEAVSVIRGRAIFLDENATIDRAEVASAAGLKAWLTRHDFFSDFLSPVEYERLLATRGPRYVGIGLELAKGASGAVVCHPFAGGPAERAGVRAGDRLVSIAGADVAGKSLPTLVAAADGGGRRAIALELVDAEGRRRRIDVARSEVRAPATTRQRHDGLSTIRLASFTADTRNDVELLLQAMKPTEPLVIDLRSNAGGDFHAAIDTAMLFLPAGRPIVSVRGRGGTRRYVGTVERVDDARPIVLWQDDATASAAEVFVAALTGNRRARSIGTKTFGKGTRQDIIELKSGAVLILTTGYLQSPDGVEFDGLGLMPQLPLAPGSRTRDYVSRTIAAIREKP